MDSGYTSANVGLTPEQEEKAWELYEKCGSMAEVAKFLEVGYHHVRSALNRDPIRLADVRECRSEQLSARWEKRESMAAEASSRMADTILRVLDHIDDCFATGEVTQLLSFKGKPMTAMEAMQWLMATRQLDTVVKLGMASAGIMQNVREFSAEFGSGGTKLLGPGGTSKDPASMTDDELHQMVNDMQLAGRPLPWGVQQWKDKQDAKSGRGSGR